MKFKKWGKKKKIKKKVKKKKEKKRKIYKKTNVEWRDDYLKWRHSNK